ncbi:hypothetical protein LG293_17350 (plasmid) [Citricoccus nitrophenolicus]
MEKLNLDTMQRLATALDGCRNLMGAPIGTEQRARIFNAVESPTSENWQDARTVLVAPSVTLWQAAVAAEAIGTGPAETPSGFGIIGAIETALEPAKAP